MRLYNTGSFPLIAATAAALLLIQIPQPGMATSEPPPATAPAPVSIAPAADLSSQAAAQPAEAAAAPVEPAKPKPLPPTLVARINLASQTMTVQAEGKTVHTWKVSSGAPGYGTPQGSFKPGWMAKMWRSRQYDDAPMPHSVFFNGGIAVHATTSIGNLGRAASHGCVRLAPANAARFYGLVSRHGMARTRIVVHGAQPFSAQANRIAKINRDGYETARSRRAARSLTGNGRTGNEWIVVRQANGGAYRVSSAGRSPSAWGDTYSYASQTPRRTAARTPANRRTR